jgi:flagellar hook protein FlgE
MSVTGMMRTSVSGMAAHANRLGTVSDNIANSSTTGYKRASTEFSSLILESGSSEYMPGGVTTNVRYSISQQGAFQFTTSVTDLGVQGDGFFVVSNDNGTPYLTRAGSFIKNGDGDLVNAAGFTLMGYSFANGDPGAVANGFAGLVPINIGQLPLQADPSTAGNLYVNLPLLADDIAAVDLPSANDPTAQYTAKTSLAGYGNLGVPVMLDVYYAKTGANTWEVTIFDRAEADPSGGFPYASGPLVTETLEFDDTTGQLTGASPTSLSIAVPGGSTLDLDISQTSQLASGYAVRDVLVNGAAPSAVERIEIGDDGTLYAVYENGARAATFRIPLAKVTSPDNLQPLAGNVYSTSLDSGDVQIGVAGSSGFGVVVSGALEKSTVDLASELTTMIESQYGYTANSKVFQTGTELMEVLINLRR